MKRLLMISLVVVLLCSIVFSGCAKQAPAPSPAPAPAPAPTPAPAPAKPIKIGIMFPLTGPMAMTGERMVNAAKFAFEQINYEVAGKKIEIIVEDSGASPSMALDKARKLVEHDRVSMILGPLVGPEKAAVGAYMAQAGIPHINHVPCTWKMTEYEWSFLAGGSNFQHPSAIGAYAADEMGLKTVTVLTRDDVDGHDFTAAFKAPFEARGGKVIQEQYTPFGASDYAPYMTALKDADAVAGWVSGADAIRYLIQYQEFGIRARMPLVALFLGSFFQSFVLNALPPAVAEAMRGEKCPTQWSPFVESEVSKQFVEDFQKAKGMLPTEADSSPYSAARVIIEALKAAGGDTTPEKLRQTLLSLDIQVPEGRIRFDPETRCAHRDIYIIKVDKVGDAFTTVPVYTYKDVPPRGL